MSHPERLPGFGEVAPPESRLADHVLRLGCVCRVEVAELVEGIARLELRLTPSTPQADHVGPVDPTHSRKAGDRHPVAPATGGLRPLPRAPVVRHCLALIDHVAVDDAGRIRRQLTGEGCHCGLTQERHSFLELTLRDERATLVLQAQRHQVATSKAGADFDRFARQLQRAVQTTVILDCEHGPQTGQVAVLDADSFVLK